ncbi:MAG: alpha-N-arabinofuranosidase [Acidobacteriota bacterium]|nr:alpha-N-arabinofuranosidase [Acidobacteriota bacterium]
MSVVSFALLALATVAVAQSAQQATLDIDLVKPLHAVSPTLYGMMTEEINYSYDGGLYAEMVRNRAMQEHDWAGIAHWRLSEMGHSSASFSIDPSTGPSSALQTSLKVEIKRADSSNQAGVLNEGWWGMALRPHTRYTGSFYAKGDSTDLGPVSLSLVNDNTGAVAATVTSAPLTSDWKRYEFTLNTGDIKPSAENHLRLTVGHAGTLWLSLVSLFPPTFRDRPNGNRPDLMQKMAAMKPAFLRLPGGNYLEGNDIQDRYDWKQTIGPLVDRPTHPSPWGYQSSDGMGLLEFLEWCEDLKMEPVLAVYAGYSLKGVHITPGPYLAPMVDDALDEIEFVTGDTGTKWGSVRAKLGHPAPFPLTYVEIGNEDMFDVSGSYEGRYAQFSKAIKAKYPKLQLIATTPVKNTRPDVIDDHYYKQASEFFQMADHYDKSDRSGPKIFVGEWATREGSPTTNLGAALGDAAWMTGMERNSDLIVMASYAPLFVNVNPGGMQWSSDLIGYDAASSYGSPSYYAQVMFAQHLGTSVPTSSISGAGERFFYSATNNGGTGLVDIKLVNASSEPQPLHIHLAGATKVEGRASVTTLSGLTTSETNSIRDPERVVPVTSAVKVAGTEFDHTVPAYSVQVIELNAR